MKRLEDLDPETIKTIRTMQTLVDASVVKLNGQPQMMTGPMLTNDQAETVLRMILELQQRVSETLGPDHLSTTD